MSIAYPSFRQTWRSLARLHYKIRHILTTFTVILAYLITFWWRWRRPSHILTLSSDIILCFWTNTYHWSPQSRGWPTLPNLLCLQSHLSMALSIILSHFLKINLARIHWPHSAAVCFLAVACQSCSTLSFRHHLWQLLANFARLTSLTIPFVDTSSLSRLTFQQFIGHIQRLFTSCLTCLPCCALLVAIFQATSCRCMYLLVTWCRRSCLLSFISPVIEGLIRRSCILVHHQSPWDILTKLVGLLLLAQDALSYDTLPLRQFPSFRQCLAMCGHLAGFV